MYSNIYADYITVTPGDYSLPDNLGKNVLEMIPEYPSPRLDVIIAEGLDMDFSLPFYFNIPANEKTIFLVDLKKIRNEAIAIYENTFMSSSYKKQFTILIFIHQITLE